MCYSLVQVSFKNEAMKETKRCQDAEDENAKINELKSKDQVSKIEIFRATAMISREERWSESPYKAPPAADKPEPKAPTRVVREAA